jgi:hypothetical protein
MIAWPKWVNAICARLKYRIMLDYDQKWSWLVGVSDFGLA